MQKSNFEFQGQHLITLQKVVFKVKKSNPVYCHWKAAFFMWKSTINEFYNLVKSCNLSLLLTLSDINELLWVMAWCIMFSSSWRKQKFYLSRQCCWSRIDWDVSWICIVFEQNIRTRSWFYYSSTPLWERIEVWKLRYMPKLFVKVVKNYS